MTTCSVGFETRSTVDLRATGVYPYAEDSGTEILCMAYAFDEEPAQIYVPSSSLLAPFPARPWDHIAAEGEMRVWNAQFERILWRVGMRKYGFPLCPDRLWHDTAAEAAAGAGMLSARLGAHHA